MNLSTVTDSLKRWPLGSYALRYCYSALRRMYYGKVVVAKRNDIQYELDLSENIDSSLYFRGVYEKETTRTLRQHILPNMVVFEVGANVGAHTFEIAKLLTDGGRLYSFEPTGYAFKKLSRNHALNSFSNVVLERIALSDRNETRTLQRSTSPDTQPFRASWDIKTKEPKDRSLDTITFETLDHYCERMHVDRLDLLKIDVDGYEARVMSGALETLKRQRPILIIELGTTVTRLGDSLDELVKTILSLGYRIRPVGMEGMTSLGDLLAMIRRRRTVDCLCTPG